MIDKLNSNGIAGSTSAPDSNDDSDVSSVNIHSSLIVAFYVLSTFLKYKKMYNYYKIIIILPIYTSYYAL